MTEEQQKNVYDGFMEKYPILFQDKNKSMKETCMCWGIECPDGWLDILTRLCDKLEFLNNTICKQYGLQIVSDQVKEKYGSLRAYYNLRPFCENEDMEKTYHLISDIVSDLIYKAEIETENVCQVCGKPLLSKKDMVVSSGWIGYYCKECAEKNGILQQEKQ